MAEGNKLVVAPGAGESVSLGGLGVVFKVTGADTDGAFAIVEHPLQPGRLAAPPHMHTREDEFSLVLEGEIWVQLGDQVFQATEGAYIVKPRGVAHTFWNAGPQPARVLEIIAPAGFEPYFEEVAAVLAAGGPPDFGKLGQIAARYGLTVYPERVPELLAKYNLTL